MPTIAQRIQEIDNREARWNDQVAAWKKSFQCSRQCEPTPGLLPKNVLAPGNQEGYFECPFKNFDCWASQKEQTDAKKADEEKILTALRLGGIPKKFAKVADFANGQETPCLRVARQYLETDGLFHGRALILCGTTGVGKTFAAVAIVRAHVVIGGSFLFGHAGRLFNRIRFADCEEKLRLIQEAAMTPLLVLDDLVCQADTEFVRAILDEIIYEREGNERATIITTNKVPGSFGGIFGDRVADRLLSEWATVFQTAGKSLRGRPRSQRHI